jgi:hypothetical protein
MDDLEQMSIKLSADLRKNIRALVSHGLCGVLLVRCIAKCCNRLLPLP